MDLLYCSQFVKRRLNLFNITYILNKERQLKCRGYSRLVTLLCKTPYKRKIWKLSLNPCTKIRYNLRRTYNTKHYHTFVLISWVWLELISYTKRVLKDLHNKQTWSKKLLDISLFSKWKRALKLNTVFMHLS